MTCDQWKKEQHEICNDCPQLECLGGNCTLRKVIKTADGQPLSQKEQIRLFGDLL